ncbi:MAG TPA: hypothetical protein VHX62_03750 [Solirubrobacteraceae bacterium]|jgi:hypothetical protein|nr:hypothetical protein [Solirubrobacteraceae bacterium]
MHNALAGAVALLMLVGLGGCGATASTSTSSPSSTGTSPTAPSSTAAPAPATTSTTSSSSGASTASVRLTPTTGYATYERCAGTCTGSVPAALRRPLHLPSADGGPCPVTLRVDGPVSAGSGTEVGFHPIAGSAWQQTQVTWTARGAYTGPVLIRGGEVGGGPMGFGEAAIPYDELQLLDAGQDAPRVADGGRAWITDTRIQSPGCYAYQVDGTAFSEVIVLRGIT